MHGTNTFKNRICTFWNTSTPYWTTHSNPNLSTQSVPDLRSNYVPVGAGASRTECTFGKMRPRQRNQIGPKITSVLPVLSPSRILPSLVSLRFHLHKKQNQDTPFKCHFTVYNLSYSMRKSGECQYAILQLERFSPISVNSSERRPSR